MMELSHLKLLAYNQLYTCEEKCNEGLTDRDYKNRVDLKCENSCGSVFKKRIEGL